MQWERGYKGASLHERDDEEPDTGVPDAMPVWDGVYETGTNNETRVEGSLLPLQ